MVGTRILDRMRKRWRALAVTVAASAGIIVGLFGLGTSVEHRLQECLFALHNHPASGQLVIVEIDARSIAAIDHWPWPRSNHAKLIDQLYQAGASSIAFDVDFSSRSTPAEDDALALALTRAGNQVILPTFSQASGTGNHGSTDSLPPPSLRDHALLAAVVVQPDEDGSVRKAPFGTVTAGVPRPSLSAMIAGRDGVADEQFTIDYAIDPSTIPRLSFLDVRNGHFDPAAVRGKRVLVGATAIEMGDRYAVPRHGVVPGVVIQALAAETLAGGIPYAAGWLAPLLVALLCGAFLVGWTTARRKIVAVMLVAVPVVIFCGALASSIWLAWQFELTPALAAWVILGTIVLAVRAISSRQRERSHDRI